MNGHYDNYTNGDNQQPMKVFYILYMSDFINVPGSLLTELQQ